MFNTINRHALALVICACYTSWTDKSHCSSP